MSVPTVPAVPAVPAVSKTPSAPAVSSPDTTEADTVPVQDPWPSPAPKPPAGGWDAYYANDLD